MDDYGFFGALFDEIANLSRVFDQLSDMLFEIDIPIKLGKKKLKIKKPSYRMNYIRPQIKMMKNLPYQRRVY